jgi:hypothetical protein
VVWFLEPFQAVAAVPFVLILVLMMLPFMLTESCISIILRRGLPGFVIAEAII